ncbi:MAG: HupE/UreJ family protein [Gemmatimonadota bacterium]|nr:HupE/UreJ family protein [Gemmatimonadota bacterium]
MGSEFLTYLQLGLRHITDIRGYDHILFVTALTVAYRTADWRRLLLLVTAFTLGHSITLALATLNLVHVPSTSVEAAIAATIVVASLMAIVAAVGAPTGDGVGVSQRGQRLRYAMAAGFGLVHGLGFSTFLRSLLGGEESLALPLFSFNLGLEVGQLGIVAAVLLLGLLAERVFRLARRDWVLIVSGGIIAMGIVMLADRIGL